MPLKSSETIKESRKWYFKYFAKIFSLGAPDPKTSRAVKSSYSQWDIETSIKIASSVFLVSGLGDFETGLVF